MPRLEGVSALLALLALAAAPPAPAPSDSGSIPAPAPAPAAAPAAPAPILDLPDDDPGVLAHARPELAPYGSWVVDPTYGEVWVPDRRVVGEHFAPYLSSGHWERVSDDRWMWVSDYPFGAVVFHYGRWVWTSHGWAWIAGGRYASAWVDWRVATDGYDYVGWAPTPPAFVWVSGVAVVVGSPPPYYWVFCPTPYVFAPYPYSYVVSRPVYLRTLARHSRPMRSYVTGAPVQSPAARTMPRPVATAPAAAGAALRSDRPASAARRSARPASPEMATRMVEQRPSAPPILRHDARPVPAAPFIVRRTAAPAAPRAASTPAASPPPPRESAPPRPPPRLPAVAPRPSAPVRLVPPAERVYSPAHVHSAPRPRR